MQFTDKAPDTEEYTLKELNPEDVEVVREFIALVLEETRVIFIGKIYNWSSSPNTEQFIRIGWNALGRILFVLIVMFLIKLIMV